MKKLFSFRYLTALCFLFVLAVFFALSLKPFLRETWYALRAGGDTALAESRFNDFLPGKEGWVTLNGGVQRLLGRREVNQRYRLENGQMTYIIPELDMEPIIHARMALGEGTGGVLLLPLLDMALRVYHGPHTFAGLGMEAYTPQGGAQ